MRVALIGTEGHAEERAEAVQQRAGAALVGRRPERLELFAQEAAPDEDGGLGALFRRADAAFIAVPVAERFRAAEAALKRGLSVFLEWPPAVSLREGERLVELAEEAGVEAGVSRPLRFHPVFGALPDGWRADLITLRETAGAARWPARLADAVDLCCALVQTSGVQRIGAQAVRAGGRMEAVSFGLRFHSGAYAQASLRRPLGEAPPEHQLYVAGPGFEAEAALAEASAVVRTLGSEAAERQVHGSTRPARAETDAFLDALAEGRPAPVSVLDALHTLRLVERLMKKLR